MKNTNSIKVMILPFLLSACSQGFDVNKGVHSNSQQMSPQGEIKSSSLSSDTIVTGRGELKTSQKIAKDKSVELDFEMNIPFGRVYSALSSVVRNAAPYTCRLTDDILSRKNVKNYAPGEIPCGIDYSADWKN